jgi:RimJ/RimL family protein N-acetyltransferase
MITALRAATTSIRPHEQASLWFTLRVAALRLAVRGLCSVVRVVTVAVAQAVALGRINSRRSACGATVGSWPATSKYAHQASTMRGLTQCSTGHLAAAHAWPSFHSGPSAVCRKAPVTFDVRPQVKSVPILRTTRLRLEPIAERHLDEIYEMDRRIEVMRYISGEPATREQTEAWIQRVQRCWAAWGFSWWALIELSSGRVAGAGCIQHARREADLPDDLDTLRSNPHEIGWRLHPDFWRKGLATEASLRMARFAFELLRARELIAVRHPENLASAGVMERLCMRYRGLETWYGELGATHVVSREEFLLAHRGTSAEA